MAVEPSADNAPRILILEPDNKVRSALLRYAIKGWQGAAVQSTSGTLTDALGDPERLRSFDVLLVGCDFSNDGTAENATLQAIRAVAAEPRNPAVILLTAKGSEYTAVQAIKSGAFDYIPKTLLGREQVVSAVQRAMLHRKGLLGTRGGTVTGVVRLFGYDMRRCLATRDSVSVHVAFSAERAREVVLKVLHRGRGSLSRDANFERLVKEFKLLYDINDHAVAEIYDFRVTSQYCYIAMEYFPLGHLGTKLDRKLPPRDALRYAREIARALAIIHTAGVVHRDLKPGNIMLRHDDSIALIDFGISRSTQTPNATETQGITREIAGTPYYMSPEQSAGLAADERADLYSLGVILYQMLTGEKPYLGATADEILEQHRSAALPALPPELEACQPLLNKLLAKDAAQRYGSAREALEALQHAMTAFADTDEQSGPPNEVRAAAIPAAAS
ncbi:MAG TPA: protein kinase [Gammaproteobacteria bacterium]|nr:protein kinase [Gammaproteobacteria bacterium]